MSYRDFAWAVPTPPIYITNLVSYIIPQYVRLVNINLILDCVGKVGVVSDTLIWVGR